MIVEKGRSKGGDKRGCEPKPPVTPVIFDSSPSISIATGNDMSLSGGGIAMRQCKDKGTVKVRNGKKKKKPRNK